MAEASLTIRTARPDEAAALEALQRRSSLVWDDTREHLLAHPEAIVVEVAELATGRVRVAELDGTVVGFSGVLPGDEPSAWELDALFVEPDRFRSGAGTALVADVVDRARPAGIERVDVTANPNALGFYEAVGFVAIGEVATRFGPGLRMALAVERLAVDGSSR